MATPVEEKASLVKKFKRRPKKPPAAVFMIKQNVMWLFLFFCHQKSEAFSIRGNDNNEMKPSDCQLNEVFTQRVQRISN